MTEREKELEAENVRLREVIEAFAATAEGAVAHHRRLRGGMQVPYHDDFAHLPPSAVSRLEWWAQRMRAVLAPSKETS